MNNINHLIHLSQPRLSVVNVAIYFNASLTLLAPESPMLLAIHSLILFLFIYIHSLSLSLLLLKSSAVNVLFLFNTSPIISAPESPITLSIHLLILLYSFPFFIHFSALFQNYLAPAQSIHYYNSTIH